MKIPFGSKPVVLGPSEREGIIQFLSSHDGVIFLSALEMLRPSLRGKTAEEVALSAKEISGYESVFENIEAILQPPEPAPAEINPAYPSLDDDSKWTESNQPK